MIIGRFEINFNGHPSFALLLTLHRVNDFLSNDDIVVYIPSGNKSCLFRFYDPWKDQFKSVSNDLHHKLVKHRTKANRAKLRETFRMLHFRNKNNKRVIEVWINAIPRKNPLDLFTN